MNLREIVDRARYHRFRRIPYLQQLSVTECGAACLAMVLAYYGRTVRISELRDVAVSARDATNAQALVETGSLYGLQGRVVTLDLEQVKLLSRGAILHWRFSHFVVLERLARDAVHVVDPARGRWRVPWEEFKRSFTGVAIVLEPTDQFVRTRTRDLSALRYVRQVLRERGFFPRIIATSMALQALGLAGPLLTRLLIDRVIPQREYSVVVVLALGAAALVLFQSWTTAVRGYLMLFLRARLDSRMTREFLDHLLDLPFDYFQRRSTGDLLSRLGSNASVREIVTGTLLSAMLDGALALGYLALLVGLSLPLAGITVLLASMQVALFVFTKHKQRQLLAEGLQAQARSQTSLVEIFSAIETLKAMGGERLAAQRWKGFFTDELHVSLKRGRLAAIVDAATTGIRTASSMTLLIAGTLQVLSGQLTLGGMMALIAVANGFLMPLINLVSVTAQLQQLVIYLQRLNDVVDTPTERDRNKGCAEHRVRGRISADQVAFRYGPISPVVVRDVSFDIREGEFVALVGRSGSGKSTLAKLLVGLYTPTSGRVLYDGVDLATLDLTGIRRQLGVVTQLPCLFGGTIRSNIAFADPSLSTERIVRAARLAHVHDDIEAMPMGYDTHLVDRGASLSGGQQQRIALARALAMDPRILLLDEATGQVDTVTEHEIGSEVARIACTKIVIAHRLSTVVHADRIFVMDAGSLVESGKHAELVRQSGFYAKLVSAQMTADVTVVLHDQ